MAPAKPFDGFGPYRVVRQIGSGGMASIFEAIDTRLGHRVALKRLHPHIADRAGASERFLREGRAAARVRHPHVVQVFALGTEEASPYLAMELLEGCDLGATIAHEGRLSVVAALGLLLPVVGAVAAAHDAGVIHRDLKPSNVFVSRGPRGRPWPKVVDFGVSKVLVADGEAAVTATDGVAGTAAYMAPEQARAGRDASFQSDQYSLAVILYQCVTGELPFAGDSMYQLFQAIMTAPLPSPSQRVSGVPPALDAIVLRALSRNPRDRFSSVRCFGAALLPFACERDRLAWNAELHGGPEEHVSLLTERRVHRARESAPSTMPPTARDTRAFARQKRLVQAARMAFLVSAGVVASTIGWTVGNGGTFSRAGSAAATLATGTRGSSFVPPAPDLARASVTANDVSPAPTSPPDAPAPAPAALSTRPRSLQPPRLPNVAASAPSSAVAESSASPPMGNNGAPILPP